jgi:branched-subunit amino acid aminotransferase/4-amino-4-deoxychorismate lyase
VLTRRRRHSPCRPAGPAGPDGEQVVWPDAGALPGVTMRLLQGVHEHRVSRVALADLGAMQAAFATNAAIGVRAIARVDGVRLRADHPIHGILREGYLDVPGEPV